jgi:hypothetical protein
MPTSLGKVDDGSAHQGAEDTTLEAVLAKIVILLQ